jgi:hypothetical protein
MLHKSDVGDWKFGLKCALHAVHGKSRSSTTSIMNFTFVAVILQSSHNMVALHSPLDRKNPCHWNPHYHALKSDSEQRDSTCPKLNKIKVVLIGSQVTPKRTRIN